LERHEFEALPRFSDVEPGSGVSDGRREPLTQYITRQSLVTRWTQVAFSEECPIQLYFPPGIIQVVNGYQNFSKKLNPKSSLKRNRLHARSIFVFQISFTK